MAAFAPPVPPCPAPPPPLPLDAQSPILVGMSPTDCPAVQLLAGLPAPAVLRQAEDRAATFSDLKGWIKRLHRRCQLVGAARCMSISYRHSVLSFLWKESLGGLRCRQAKELMRTLLSIQEFTKGVDIDEQEGPLPMSSGDWQDNEDTIISPEVDELPFDDIPTLAQLQDPHSNSQELFTSIRDWVRRQKKQEGGLHQVGLRLGLTYRRAVFDFLCSFVFRKPAFRGRAQDLLRQLSEVDEWTRGGAMDADAMAKALGFTGQVAADQASNEEGMAVALPSEAELQDPSSDPQEIMQRLCAWVEAGRRSGHLEMEAKALDASHRRAIVEFLCLDAPPLEDAANVKRSTSGLSRMMPSRIMRRNSQAAAAPKSVDGPGVSPERYYVLHALASLDKFFDQDDAGDRSAVSRALAQMPPQAAVA